MRYMLGGVEAFVHRDEQPQRLLTALRDVVVGRHDWFLAAAPSPMPATWTTPSSTG